MATIQPKHEKCEGNEMFVGNVGADRDLSYLKGVNFRRGNVAYDIHGEKINENLLRPLFIKKEDSDKYDAIMMAQVRAIRNVS